MLDKMNTGSYCGWTNYSTHEIYSTIMNDSIHYNYVLNLGSSVKNIGQFADIMEDQLCGRDEYISNQNHYINWVEIAESIAEEYHLKCCECKECAEEEDLQREHEKYMNKWKNHKWIQLLLPKKTTPSK